MKNSFTIIAAACTGTTVGSGCLPQPGASTSVIGIVLSVVFSITASIALLVIVIAGFRYILAHGDPNAVAQARNTILYAIVGLVISMTAFGIVTFVVKGIG